MTIEEQIRVMEAEQVKAVLAHDTAALERIWSPQLMVNAPDNKVRDNAGVFALMREGGLKYSAYDQTIESIRVFGDTVVVMGQETTKPITGPMAGKTVQRRYTDVWQRSGDGWVEIARHASVIGVA